MVIRAIGSYRDNEMEGAGVTGGKKNQNHRTQKGKQKEEGSPGNEA